LQTVPEPGHEQTPPNGWESPQVEGAHRPPEELLVELINLFRQLLAVAQALLDLLEQRVGATAQSGARREQPREVDIPIL
jgi:hypothetical protein